MDAGITDITSSAVAPSAPSRTLRQGYDWKPTGRARQESRSGTGAVDPPRCQFSTSPGRSAGLGHAVLCAQPVVGNEPFAVILADDLIDGTPPVMKQMVDQYQYYSVRAWRAAGGARGDRLLRHRRRHPDGRARVTVNGIVEKPKPEVAPSTLGVVGRYILTRASSHIQHLKPGAGGELQLTDAIAACERTTGAGLCFRRHPLRRGSKLGYLQATVDMR